MLIHDLKQKGLIQPPSFLADNCQFLTMMGSIAYGASTDASDRDVYGIVIPRKDDVFPHLRGEVLGFGRHIQRFENWVEHHVKDGDVEWDFSIFSIVKVFNLVMEGSPNMIDMLYTPRNCILHSTEIAEHIRSNRQVFLSAKVHHTFRGYAYSQFSKIKSKKSSSNPKRQATIETVGYDTKDGYNCVRILLEGEQLLATGDLELNRDARLYRAIRNGEWSLDRLEKWFEEKERHLEKLYAETKLPYSPDETAIKKLLLECLEMHYGNLSDAIKVEKPIENLVRDLQTVLSRYS